MTAVIRSAFSLYTLTLLLCITAPTSVYAMFISNEGYINDETLRIELLKSAEEQQPESMQHLQAFLKQEYQDFPSCMLRKTWLHYAAEYQCPETIERCLNSLAQRDSRLKNKKTQYINAQDEHGNTPFALAVYYGNRDALFTLIAHGADIYLENFVQQSALIPALPEPLFKQINTEYEKRNKRTRHKKTPQQEYAENVPTLLSQHPIKQERLNPRKSAYSFILRQNSHTPENSVYYKKPHQIKKPLDALDPLKSDDDDDDSKTESYAPYDHYYANSDSDSENNEVNCNRIASHKDKCKIFAWLADLAK